MAKAKPAGKKTPPQKAKIVLSGDVKTSGQVTGTGTLSLRVSDAAKVKWSVIKKKSSVLLRLESSVGLSIRQDRKLTLSGAIDRDLTKKTLDGRVTATLASQSACNEAMSRVSSATLSSPSRTAPRSPSASRSSRLYQACSDAGIIGQ